MFPFGILAETTACRQLITILLAIIFGEYSVATDISRHAFTAVTITHFRYKYILLYLFNFFKLI